MIELLLIEDNEGDIVLINEAFEEGRVLNELHICRDGEQAIHFLTKKGQYSDAVTPDLVILDINLPRKNGHEVLEFIKKSEKLRHIPVIMLTTSSSENDIIKSYSSHANCYITKPLDVEDFLKAVVEIEQFWIKLVKLPKDKA